MKQWQNTSNGQVAVWHMKGSGALRLSTGIIVRDMAGWKLVAVEDMNKDGKDDLIWMMQRTTTQVALWRMDGNGSRVSAGLIANVAAAWKVGPVADYNNDGNMDMVWFRPDTGQASCTLLDASNVSISETVLGTVSGYNLCPW